MSETFAEQSPSNLDKQRSLGSMPAQAQYFATIAEGPKRQLFRTVAVFLARNRVVQCTSTHSCNRLRHVALFIVKAVPSEISSRRLLLFLLLSLGRSLL